MIHLKKNDMLDHSESFLISPLYATSLLYWSARTDKVSSDDVNFILENMEAHPEAPIAIVSEKERTPCHAAAIGGDPAKIDSIYEDFLLR